MQELRDHIVPAAFPAHSGITANITGEAAGVHDFNTLMHDRAPLVIGFVLLVSFLLLLATFRSLVVPIKAIVLNLLSVGAAYGILVAVFQNRWAEDLLGFESDGAIESWLPIFLFVVLFGLSMDYHVFIVSRIRELWDRGTPTRTAVEQGITETAGVVTSAALVMIAVFGVFATLTGLDMKQLGVGLASAILIDATIVRAVLLPAAMSLLGDANWYLPRNARVAAAHQPRPARAGAGGEPLIQHRSRRGAVRRHGGPLSGVFARRGPTCDHPVSMNVGDLIVALNEATSSEELRVVLGRALGDPELQIAYWLPAHAVWVDDGGRRHGGARARRRRQRDRARHRPGRDAHARPVQRQRPRACRPGHRRCRAGARERAPPGRAAVAARRAGGAAARGHAGRADGPAPTPSSRPSPRRSGGCSARARPTWCGSTAAPSRRWWAAGATSPAGSCRSAPRSASTRRRRSPWCCAPASRPASTTTPR